MQIIQVVLNSLGTFFAEMCFGLVYLYCAELYPTGLRATATGTCSSVGRLGGIFALCIEGLGQVWAPLPLILVGSQGIAAGLMALAFPETTGTKLPETITEALDETGKSYKLKPWCVKTT